MDPDLLRRLDAFVRPLYQDLDGVSRVEDIERVRRIARSIYSPPTPQEERMFELLLLFHGLGKWLDRVGNASRTVLAVDGITDVELRRTAAAIGRLDSPSTNLERAVAAAILIDRAGVRGLAVRFAAARREGQSVIDVVREAVADAWIPEWVPESARPLLEKRLEARRRFCMELLEEN